MNLSHVSVLLDPFCCPPFLFYPLLQTRQRIGTETRNYEPFACECFA
jgi:hypothetical protein